MKKGGKMLRDATCQDRIDGHLQSRADDFTAMFLELQGDTFYSDEAFDRFNEYGLCFDYVEAGTFNDQAVGYWRYQIAYGGPSEEIRWHDTGTVEYWFLDWYDGASRDITGLDWVETLTEMLGLTITPRIPSGLEGVPETPSRWALEY